MSCSNGSTLVAPSCKSITRATTCSSCRKQFTGKDVVWLTIDSSAAGKEGYLTPEEANKQVADWKMKSTALLLDPTGKVGHEYAATNTPHMYVIDPSGKLIYSGAIDDKPSTNPRRCGRRDELRESGADGSDGGQACGDADLARLRLLNQIRAITEGRASSRREAFNPVSSSGDSPCEATAWALA